MIKTLRLAKGLSIFDVAVIMKIIKRKSIERTESKIKNDPTIGEDMLTDHNNIELLLAVSYVFKTLKLVLIIVNISFFMAIGWLIIVHFVDQQKTTEAEEHTDNFIEYFDIHELKEQMGLVPSHVR